MKAALRCNVLIAHFCVFGLCDWHTICLEPRLESDAGPKQNVFVAFGQCSTGGFHSACVG